MRLRLFPYVYICMYRATCVMAAHARTNLCTEYLRRTGFPYVTHRQTEHSIEHFDTRITKVIYFQLKLVEKKIYFEQAQFQIRLLRMNRNNWKYISILKLIMFHKPVVTRVSFYRCVITNQVGLNSP